MCLNNKTINMRWKEGKCCKDRESLGLKMKRKLNKDMGSFKEKKNRKHLYE